MIIGHVCVNASICISICMSVCLYGCASVCMALGDIQGYIFCLSACRCLSVQLFAPTSSNCLWTCNYLWDLSDKVPCRYCHLIWSCKISYYEPAGAVGLFSYLKSVQPEVIVILFCHIAPFLCNISLCPRRLIMMTPPWMVSSSASSVTSPDMMGQLEVHLQLWLSRMWFFHHCRCYRTQWVLLALLLYHSKCLNSRCLCRHMPIMPQVLYR